MLVGRKVTVALGPAGSDLILNGKLSQVGAEEAYTNFTTPYVSPIDLAIEYWLVLMVCPPQRLWYRGSLRL